jgi:hypothetical protein
MITKTSLRSILVATSLAALAFAARPASASVAIAVTSINASFMGDDGTIGDTATDGYTTQFTDPDGTVTFDASGLSFSGDDITLNYTPTGVEGLFQPANLPVANSFTGTDFLSTTTGGSLDLSLSGSYSGPTGSIGSVGGSQLDFTGTATITGGTLGLTGSSPFSATVTQVNSVEAVGGFTPLQTTPASFTANYGSLAPEPSGLSILAVIGGGLGLAMLRARKRQSVTP